MKLIALSSIEELLGNAAILCVPACRDKAAWIHENLLSHVVPAGILPAPAELASLKASPLVFLGQWQGRQLKVVYWNEGETFTEASLYALVRKMAIRVKSDFPGTPALILNHVENAGMIRSAFAGWTAGQYDLGLYKQTENKNNQPAAELNALLHSPADEAIARDGVVLGQVQQEIMHLVNAPGSHKTPATLGAWAARSAAQHGYTAHLIDKQQLFSLGMHALLAVNRGSEHPAMCIVTHYKHPESKHKIALVGKGVMFDTGGISIKASKNLHYMKSDMAGAAAVLGTVEACARLKLPVEVYAIAPATDNSVDSLSIRPGDVISSFAGKSIEVIDTDAEGRLVLADALAYAIKEFQPDVILDLATLTGSVVAALGPHAAGLFTKNESLADSLEAAGQVSGERVWRLPMFDDYQDDMQSDIADIKNLSEKPYAGAITAAKFLEYFTADHTAWAHLDIAGVSFQPNGFGKGNCATGYGVRLLVEWLTRYTA